MKQKDVLAIANKIIGVYVLIQALNSAQYIGMALFVPGEQGPRAWIIAIATVPFLLFTIAGLFLIKWAEPIAVRLSNQNEVRSFQASLKKTIFNKLPFQQ